jgi:hypothetical protein
VFSFEHLGGPVEKSASSIMQAMCQSCVEIDKRVEKHRKLLRSTTDPAEIERIKGLISELYADRVRSHQNPER